MLRLCCLSLLLLSHSVSTSANTAIKPFIAGSFSFLRTSSEFNYGRTLMTKALAEQGYRLEIKFYPGRRLMAQLNNGLIDGDMGRSFNMSQRFDNIVRVEEPLQQHCAQLYQLGGRQAAKLSGGGKPVRIGIYGGTPGVTASLLARWPNATLVNNESLKQGVQLLNHERIDLLIIGSRQAAELRQYSERPLIIADTFALPATHIHVHKRHKQLALDLADSFKRLKLIYPPPSCDPNLPAAPT